jgi:beta-phosphoglucomutase
MIREMRAAIFDLDGVIVDTAKYHYLAWKRLANENGFDLTPAQNERLKGVSRVRSLEILLEIGGLMLDPATQAAWAERKNAWYVESIQAMPPSEVFPGVEDYLLRLRDRGVKTALGSASKNAPLILERLGINGLFDAIVDGNTVKAAKPDPEVFLSAAAQVNVPAGLCVVFEDAGVGIEAALRAGMGAVGIGLPSVLFRADAVIRGIDQLLILGCETTENSDTAGRPSGLPALLYLMKNMKKSQRVSRSLISRHILA